MSKISSASKIKVTKFDFYYEKTFCIIFCNSNIFLFKNVVIRLFGCLNRYDKHFFWDYK